MPRRACWPCTASCTFNTQACTLCGNGAVNAGEQCDGANVNGQSCQSLGFSAGSLFSAFVCVDSGSLLFVDVTGGEQDCDLALWRFAIDMRAVDVVQPDVCYIGGINRTLKVVEMAKKVLPTDVMPTENM